MHSVPACPFRIKVLSSIIVRRKVPIPLKMTYDCDEVHQDLLYNCSNPWGQGCSSSDGFNFANLWNYTLNIQKACDSDTRLSGVSAAPATPQNAALSQLSCDRIVGSNWAYYSGADIWTRLTTWKFPLLQLVSSFPRPPLGFWVQMFVINHLLGDPIDTLKNLFAKMSDCQLAAAYWKERCQPRAVVGYDAVDHDWKELTIIEETYAEWGVRDRARREL